jgi:hypothetical protein
MSSFVVFLNHWWNLPFLVMLLLVAAYFVLQLVGLVGHGGGDHDVATDSDADSQAAAHGPHAGGGDTVHDVLAFFGVGRVPFMIVWVTLFLFAGFTGLIVNRVVYLSFGGAAPGWLFPVSLGAALAVGLAGVRVFARAAARLVDVGGHGATAKHELVGKLGVVASAALDARFGEVRVHDGKDEILVHGRLQEGEAPLQRGARVVIVDYDAPSELYWVTGSPDIDAAA